MKIAIIGASGYVGSALLNEALARGHSVTALVSNPDKLATHEGLSVVKADALNTESLSASLRGHEAVISAFSGHAHSDVLSYYLNGFQSIVAATKQAAVPRLLMVGGAGSLLVAPGLQLVDTPQFPAQWKATAEGARQALRLLQDEIALDWTMLSPSAHLEPGARSAKFRLGGDQLLADAKGESRISLADYALAMIDELERPAHRRQRFTVGY
ncbi:NAD(P)-dependent oxidoreductase [Pseudomonas sp.]|uniref:NAD(P)-dependent oxidoreductase n=1 Tax=Pseudomonas sp. TaxID=306 RepID=UPI002734B3D5|nr:NAD(P)-dependent oxidoreductase [Pseudomonas sp.]MDP3814483.1 NAD(P)-dependent oxidoreductase [Pseudomonas sp.]